MAGFFVLVNLWNATFFPDEEDELGESQRRQLHLILGRNSDRSIRTIRIQGAFSDALSWFGAEDIVQDVKSYISGKKSLGDIAKDSALSGPIRIINALRRDVKVAGKVIGGQGWCSTRGRSGTSLSMSPARSPWIQSIDGWQESRSAATQPGSSLSTT